MPIGFLGDVFGGAIAAGASYANTRQTNEMNLKIARETNEANRQMVEMQNEAARQQAELAYKRSSASNQVNLMRGAGMSRAGAINALNGGGSYTPAPVNTSQDSAPQMQTADLSMLANIGQGLEAISQRKHDEKMQAKQLAAAKEQHQAQLESNERIAQLQANTTNRNADNRLDFDKNKWNDEVKVLRANIRNIDANTELTNQQKEQIKQLLPFMKQNAIEEINKLKEEVSSIKSIRDLDAKRFALERLKVRLESYYGVSINHMRNTLEYWEDKPETLYKGFQWRKGQLKDLDSKETDLQNYLEELNELLDSFDSTE